MTSITSARRFTTGRRTAAALIALGALAASAVGPAAVSHAARPSTIATIIFENSPGRAAIAACSGESKPPGSPSSRPGVQCQLFFALSDN